MQSFMYLEKLSSIIKVAFLVFLLILGSILLALFFKKMFHKRSKLALIEYAEKDILNEQFLCNSLALTEYEKEELLEKYRILAKRKEIHMRLFTDLYSIKFCCNSVFPFLSGISLILTFFIGQRGWKQCSFYLQGLFLTIIFLTGIAGIYPRVFDANDAHNKNLQNFIAYTKIQKKITDYSRTKPLLYSDTLQYYLFLDQINKEEQDLINIFFGVQEVQVNNDLLSNFNF